MTVHFISIEGARIGGDAGGVFIDFVPLVNSVLTVKNTYFI